MQNVPDQVQIHAGNMRYFALKGAVSVNVLRDTKEMDETVRVCFHSAFYNISCLITFLHVCMQMWMSVWRPLVCVEITRSVPTLMAVIRVHVQMATHGMGKTARVCDPPYISYSITFTGLHIPHYT